MGAEDGKGYIITLNPSPCGEGSYVLDMTSVGEAIASEWHEQNVQDEFDSALNRREVWCVVPRCLPYYFGIV